MSNESENDVPKDVPPPSREEDQPDLPAAEPKKRLLPPSRIAFLIFVVAAGVVIVLELCARLPYERSRKAVDQAWETGKTKGTNLYRQEIDELLKGSPAHVHDEEKGVEVITWRGALKQYRIRLKYGKGGFVQNYRSESGWVWED